MRLATTYELRVPNDALAEIDTTGILGASFANIDVSDASGPPIENYGYLKAKPAKLAPSLQDVIKALGLGAALADASKASEAPESKTSSPQRRIH